MASCDSSLPLESRKPIRIPDRLRAQIWAGEFVDLSLLLKSTHAQQEYSLSVGGRDSDAPTFRVSTAKVKGSNLSLEQWMKAFHLYMSVYLMQPSNLPSARKMLKYMQVIQNLYDQGGGDWQAYDEAFRSLHYLRGWAWDFMNWELWLQASQSRQRWANSKGAPFTNKGKARHPSSNPCFAFNRGELCNAGNCRYAHKCRHCGDNHPVVRCRQVQGKQTHSGKRGLSANGSSANGPTVWPESKLPSPSPVSPVALSKLLTGYDVNLAAYHVHGFTYGFRIGCIGLPPQLPGVVHNLKSSEEFSEVIDRKIAKELALGRIVGPHDAPPPYSNYRVSPLAVVPKKAPGEFRMIHHLSYPEGSSINDFIPRDMSSVQYATIQDATYFINQSNKPVYMAKRNVESAFRVIPVSPADRLLLGFQWHGKFFMDAVLPMGCSH